MLVSEAGDVLGSLSGGCVEGAVVAAALEVMADGGTRREFFGYSAEDAFAVGLTCGGELEVHIELLADALGGLRPEGLNTHGRPRSRHGPGAHPPARCRVPGRCRMLRRGAGAVVIPDPASYQVAQSEAVAALLGVAGGTRPRCRRPPRSWSPC